MANKTLNKMSKGEKALVKDIIAESVTKRRLMDLGIVKGTVVEKLYTSPSGSPSAYLIRGAVIALREEEAENITVEGEYDNEVHSTCR